MLRLSRKSSATPFANTLPVGVIDTAYDDYVVPAPGRPYFQASLAIGNGVSYKRLTHLSCLTGDRATCQFARPAMNSLDAPGTKTARSQTD